MEREKRGVPSFSLARIHKMRGLDGVDWVMDVKRARSRALIMMGSGTIEASWLLKVVSWVSLQERVSAGPI